MSDYERIPVEVWPLAYFLAEEMDARGWTAVDVAARMGGTSEQEVFRNAVIVDLILAVQKDGCLIGDKTFNQLSRAFGVSAQYFRNLDVMWRKWPDRRVQFTVPEHLLAAGTFYEITQSANKAIPDD